MPSGLRPFGGVEHRHVDVALDRLERRIDGVEGVHLVVLDERDRLAATADRDLDAVEQHRASGERDRLQAGGALPIDGGAGGSHRQAGAQQRLAGDVAAGGALLHRRAHHHVLDLLRVDTGALHRVLDGVAEQCGTLGGVEGAAIRLAEAPLMKSA